MSSIENVGQVLSLKIEVIEALKLVEVRLSQDVKED